MEVHTHKPYVSKQQQEQQFKTDMAEVKISLKPYRKWLPAFVVLGIVLLLLWAPWNDSLYEKYASKGQMLVTQQGLTGQNDLAIGASLYNEGDYVAAEPYLEKAYLADMSNASVGYYYGIVLIETQQEDVARTVLTKVFVSETQFKYDVAFFIALSYLKEDNTPECVGWLKRIPSTASSYAAAMQLLTEL